MRFPSKTNGKILKPSPLQPVLPLLHEVCLPRNKIDLNLSPSNLKCARSCQLQHLQEICKSIRRRKLQQWIDRCKDLEEIMTQKQQMHKEFKTSLKQNIVLLTVQEYTHLTQEEQTDLLKQLQKFERLFEGNWGHGKQNLWILS